MTGHRACIGGGMDPNGRRGRALSEVEALAWLLDNSIPVPLTGGRRFGIDALIGLVPLVGDLASGGIGLFVIWRASRLGLPKIVLARMLANLGLDVVIGAIPVIGDAFDLWFKANMRNVGLLRRYLERPERSTCGEWLALAVLVGILAAVIVMLGWLLVSVLSALAGALR